MQKKIASMVDRSENMEKNKIFENILMEIFMPIYSLRINSRGPSQYYNIKEECQPGDFVLIEQDRGEIMARVETGPISFLPGTSPENLPGINRIATEKDMEIHRENEIIYNEAKAFCKKCIKERQLDMKLVDVDVFFDRSKFIFYFTAPSRIDFRELVKDLVRTYRARIELRQIGVRHDTQRLGAIGNCGRVCCCRGHLRKFAPVTIKMAKEQNLFLNPSKISGICGRLLCCLSYEQENYENFHRIAPRCNKRYHTDRGIYKIQRANMFTNSVLLLTEKNEEVEMSMEDWKNIHPVKIKNDYSGNEDGNQGMTDLDEEMEDLNELEME